MHIYEIKRRLLLGVKAMTDLGNVLKTKDITLLTKVHIVNLCFVFVVVVVFSVVTCRCESFTIKKAEC